MTIDRDALLNKVASSDIRLNPHVLDVVRRVRVAGLHKTASALHLQNAPMSLKTAAQIIGTQLLASAARRNKIASGIAAIRSLDDNG